MDIRKNTSQNISQDIMNGNSHAVMMNASVRQNQGLNINIELLDPEYAAANHRDIAIAVTDFVHEAMELAQSSGIPVAGGNG